MMEKESVWSAMSPAFKNTAGDFADRMMAALEAAEKEGGDSAMFFSKDYLKIPCDIIPDILVIN